MNSFHGRYRRRSYFEGWYFKQQGPKDTVIFIPSFHIDETGRRSACLQVIADGINDCVEFPYAEFHALEHALNIRLGANKFSAYGIDADIKSKRLNIKGSLRFGELNPLKYDIMEPFSFVPFMQCRHSVFSMTHSVSGRLNINGRDIDFADSTGYIEGDRGCSFPKRYVWTQCSWADEAPCSLMLSVADIPLAFSGFTGVAGFVLHNGRQFRIATYLGAKPVRLSENCIVVRQRDMELRADILDCRTTRLKAPLMGSMTRFIKESPVCRIRYRLVKKGCAVFDFVSDNAGFEYEY